MVIYRKVLCSCYLVLPPGPVVVLYLANKHTALLKYDNSCRNICTWLLLTMQLFNIHSQNTTRVKALHKIHYTVGRCTCVVCNAFISHNYMYRYIQNLGTSNTKFSCECAIIKVTNLVGKSKDMMSCIKSSSLLLL